MATAAPFAERELVADIAEPLGGRASGFGRVFSVIAG